MQDFPRYCVQNTVERQRHHMSPDVLWKGFPMLCAGNKPSFAGRIDASILFRTITVPIYSSWEVGLTLRNVRHTTCGRPPVDGKVALSNVAGGVQREFSRFPDWFPRAISMAPGGSNHLLHQGLGPRRRKSILNRRQPSAHGFIPSKATQCWRR